MRSGVESNHHRDPVARHQRSPAMTETAQKAALTPGLLLPQVIDYICEEGQVCVCEYWKCVNFAAAHDVFRAFVCPGIGVHSRWCRRASCARRSDPALPRVRRPRIAQFMPRARGSGRKPNAQSAARHRETVSAARRVGVECSHRRPPHGAECILTSVRG